MPGIHGARREIRPAPPFRETEFDITCGKRISQSGELLDLATNHDIVEKSGAWYSYGSDRLGQGREAVKHFIEENPDIAQRITVAVREKLGFAPKEAKEAQKPQIWVPQVYGAPGTPAKWVRISKICRS